MAEAVQLAPLAVAGWLAAGYAAGSVPFAVLVARAKGVDILRSGSGNPGATNVGRILGRPYGFAVFGLDFLKGAIPVLGARLYGGGQAWLPEIALIGAVLGHVFSPFLGFRGGKGVATGAGAFAVLLPLPAAVAAGFWMIAVIATGYVSVGSLLAVCSMPASSWLLGYGGRAAALCAAVAALVVWLHRGNLARLRAGSEPRLRRRGAGPAP